jgi:hypothetical protein
LIDPNIYGGIAIVALYCQTAANASQEWYSTQFLALAQDQAVRSAGLYSRNAFGFAFTKSL